MSRTPENTITPEVADNEAENKPAVTVRHRSSHTVSRRRFLSGSLAGSLAIGGSAILGSSAALAADCDRNPEQAERCSDGDQGEGADPANCGRCGQESTVPSSYRITDPVQSDSRQRRKSTDLSTPDASLGVKRISD